MFEEYSNIPGKCAVCNKKYGLLSYTCKCGVITCNIHRWPSHKCTFDYKSHYQNELEKNNPKIEPLKINTF